MSKLKIPKHQKWAMARPGIVNPLLPVSRDITPLYYIQQGNVLFLKIEDKTYVIEINKEKLPEENR